MKVANGQYIHIPTCFSLHARIYVIYGKISAARTHACNLTHTCFTQFRARRTEYSMRPFLDGGNNDKCEQSAISPRKRVQLEWFLPNACTRMRLWIGGFD